LTAKPLPTKVPPVIVRAFTALVERGPESDVSDVVRDHAVPNVEEALTAAGVLSRYASSM
jgi:hypothetical protein